MIENLWGKRKLPPFWKLFFLSLKFKGEKKGFGLDCNFSWLEEKLQKNAAGGEGFIRKKRKVFSMFIFCQQRQKTNQKNAA